MLDMGDIARLVDDLELETQRLRVRRFAERDIETDIEHQLTPGVMRFIRVVPSITQAATNSAGYCEPWVGVEAEWCAFAVIRKDGVPAPDTMIGCVVFRVESTGRDTAELGYRFHPDHYGRGFATEACARIVELLFEEIRVRKITALCDIDNTASIRLLERLGMRREAHLREYSRREGEWRDAVELGLFRDEFRG